MGTAFKRFLGTVVFLLVTAVLGAGFNSDNYAAAEPGDWKARFSLSKLPIPSFLVGNQLIADMQLMPQDKAIFDACVNNYKRQKSSHLTPSITAEEGCACTAKQASAKVQPKDLSLLMRIHAVSLNNQLMRSDDLTAAQVKTVNAQWKVIMSNLKKNSGMSSRDYSKLFKTASNIQAICASDESYSPASIARIAALQPIGYIKTSMVVTPRLKPLRKS